MQEWLGCFGGMLTPTGVLPDSLAALSRGQPARIPRLAENGNKPPRKRLSRGTDRLTTRGPVGLDRLGDADRIGLRCRPR